MIARTHIYTVSRERGQKYFELPSVFFKVKIFLNDSLGHREKQISHLGKTHHNSLFTLRPRPFSFDLTRYLKASINVARGGGEGDEASLLSRAICFSERVIKNAND